MNHRGILSFLVLLFLATATLRADGPADNVPSSVRRMPKPGIVLPPEVRKELESGLGQLRSEIDRVSRSLASGLRGDLPDVEICHKAVRDALVYDEFFSPAEVEKARELLKLGQSRVSALEDGDAPWTRLPGRIVRGHRSKIDGSVQPYGLVIPEGPLPAGGYRLDVWFHGRGETLSELNFLDDRLKNPGEFTPPGAIVLHPYGRYCNANKFAGEVDALEAIASVRARYKIDPDRVAVRGFSMGGASCWQFAVHYADQWFAANPGAGFAETPRFLKVFQNEAVQPSWYEKALWHLYDCPDWAENLAQCPTVAYSGELDAQKQAADVMAEALDKEGIDLIHVIGPKTKHAFHPAAKVEIERRLSSLADAGRQRFPDEVRFTTYTLKYNRMNWVTIDALGEHWARARVHARRTAPDRVDVSTENVTAMTLEFPPGFAPFPNGERVRVAVDGTTLTAGRVRSDRSWSLSLVRTDGVWMAGQPPEGLRKQHDLQGPIDDAFMDSFLIVRPTGRSGNVRFQDWSSREMARAIEHWRRHFRGEARVKDDTQVLDSDIASSNLILWGDPRSNAVLAQIADRLPVRWSPDEITAGDRRFKAQDHALILAHPNPLNPSRYVVLNSGFTFREYDYLNNARQVPKLPDWAVIDLRTPPDSRLPGKVVAADFFDERWQLRPVKTHD